MRLLRDAEVFSSLGEKIGLLDRVVLDPSTKEVTHIVVKKGLLFATGKVIPISYVNQDGERITLTKNATELNDLPEFDESSYTPLDIKEHPEENAEPIYWYPPPNVVWWSTGGRIWYPRPEYVLKTENPLPEGEVALEEGAKVIGSDGEELGRLDRVIVETSDERATHIAVSKGFFVREHKLIPTPWITDVTEKKVYLSIDSDFFKHLPEYQLTA